MTGKRETYLWCTRHGREETPCQSAPSLDVERLGRALHAVYCRGRAPMHSEPHHSARAIATAYDADA